MSLVGAKNTEMDFLHDLKWVYKRQWAQTETEESPLKFIIIIKKKPTRNNKNQHFLLWKCSSSRAGFPKRLWSLSLWRYSWPDWSCPSHPTPGDLSWGLSYSTSRGACKLLWFHRRSEHPYLETTEIPKAKENLFYNYTESSVENRHLNIALAYQNTSSREITAVGWRVDAGATPGYDVVTDVTKARPVQTRLHSVLLGQLNAQRRCVNLISQKTEEAPPFFHM